MSETEKRTVTRRQMAKIIDEANSLQKQARRTPLVERLDQAGAAIGKMTAEGRPPKMSIPTRVTDEDVLILIALEDAAELLEIVRDVADLEGKCSLDHHGFCQEHSWFDAETKCPHARAQELLQPTAADTRAAEVKE